MSRQRQKMPPAAKLTATDAERLNGWTPQIATELRPEAPANTGSDGSTRVGRQGSLAITAEAGVWYDHESGKGGVTALSLISHLLGKTSSPLRWAQEFPRSHEGAGPLSQRSQLGKTDLPEPGEFVVVRDGDAPESAADKALRTAVDRLILAGHGTVSSCRLPMEMQTIIKRPVKIWPDCCSRLLMTGSSRQIVSQNSPPRFAGRSNTGCKAKP